MLYEIVEDPLLLGERSDAKVSKSSRTSKTRRSHPSGDSTSRTSGRRKKGGDAKISLHETAPETVESQPASVAQEVTGRKSQKSDDATIAKRDTASQTANSRSDSMAREVASGQGHGPAGSQSANDLLSVAGQLSAQRRNTDKADSVHARFVPTTEISKSSQAPDVSPPHKQAETDAEKERDTTEVSIHQEIPPKVEQEYSSSPPPRLG